jgi:tetratricopeptide (TPR) repeat protein
MFGRVACVLSGASDAGGTECDRNVAIPRGAVKTGQPGAVENRPVVGGQFQNRPVGLYYAQGRYAEAQPLYERALAIYEEALGPDHPAVGTTLNNLAELYRAQGRYAEAQPLYERALAICEQALGPDHPRRCGDSKKLSSPGGKTSVVHDFSSSSYDLKSGEFLTLSVAPLLAAYGPQPTRG